MGTINAAMTMTKVARLVPLVDNSFNLMSKIKGYWEDTDGEFDGYVKEVKKNLKSIQEVCNDIINYLLENAIEVECKDQSDDQTKTRQGKNSYIKFYVT